MKRLTPCLLLLMFCVEGYSQKEWANSYFSGNNRFTFKNGFAEIQTNFATPTPGSPFSYVHVGNSGISYSDPATGEMKFVLASRMAFDKNYDVIASSWNLRACPGDKYAFHIIPFTNNPNKFYVIQFQDVHADLLAAETGLQVRCPNAIGLAYAVFDLSLNGGLGDFVSMNNVLMTGLPERISLVRHGNGKDTWIVVHGYNNSEFNAFLATDAGIQSAVKTSIGPYIGGTSGNATGSMIASHDGKTLAAWKSSNNFVELYDFDNNTGSLSNYRTFSTTNRYAARMMFSPDDSKLYLADYDALVQFDLNQADIASTLTYLWQSARPGSGSIYDIMLGLDGKVYISRFSVLDGSDYKDYLGVVHCPNLPQYASRFEAKGVYAPWGAGNFPPLINDYIKDPKAPPVTKFDLGPDVAVCFGSYTITAPPGWQSYTWNTGETTQQITVTQPGLYYVLAGNTGFSCPSGYGFIRLSNAALPLNVGNDVVVCPKETYTIHVPNDFNNILWSDGRTDRDRLVTVGGVFSLQATDQNGCMNWDTIGVGFKSQPRAFFGADTVLCNDQTLLLELEPRINFFYQADKYAWSDGSSKDTLRIRQPGTYWGEVTWDGCVVKDTITVHYVSATGVNLGADTTLCQGDSLILNATIPGAQYLWSNSETAPSITVKTAGKYWVKASHSQCTVTDTIQIAYSPKPFVFLGNDTILCEKDKLVLRAKIPGASHLWQDGSIADTLTAALPGDYRVKVNLNGCVVNDTIHIGNKPLPVVYLGRDTTLCDKQSLLLNATHASVQSYIWNDNSTAATKTIQQAGDYWVAVTGTNGCFNRDTIKVQVTSLPVFSLGADTALCEQQTWTAGVNLSNATYLWNTGAVSNTLRIETPGDYWLRVNRNGCAKTDTVTVWYKPLPVVQLGKDTTLCEGVSYTLNAGSNMSSYLWSNNATSPTIQVRTAGVYWARVSLQGCIQSDTIAIAYKPKPVLNLGRDTALCMGELLMLNLHSDNTRTYVWQDGSTQATFLAREAGTYSVTATNECGTSTDKIVVEPGLCQLVMPNAFTPNKNGVNDVFRIKYPGYVRNFHMIVFNRWGEKIFETTDPRKGWDGTKGGLDQPSGTYVWMIKLTNLDGKQEQGKGVVNIIR